MADVRINDLPSAASWNGFFPQDKPGGPTECVSVATVEARLELDGFVKTAMLVAGYQPLENQRLRTTDSPAFAAGRIAGLKIQDDPVITTYGNIYGSGIATPSDTNWSASFAKDGSNSLIRGQADVALQTPSSFARLSVAAFNISKKLQIAGVDRITAAGGFVGTSLQISGATANKLARFDASKNLVSYDLTLTIGATGKVIDGTANQSWSLAEIGAQAAGSYQPLEDQRLSTSDKPAFGSTLPPGGAGNGYGLLVGSYANLGASSTAALAVALPSGYAPYSFGIDKAGTNVFGIDQNGVIRFPTGSFADPSYTTRSIGTKIVIYPALSGSSVDYAHGIGPAGNMWASVENSIGRFDWFAGTSRVASISGTGVPSFFGLTGATTRIATINAAGQIGATDSPNVAKLQIAGVDRITAAGGFVGTSLQISGVGRFTSLADSVNYNCMVVANSAGELVKTSNIKDAAVGGVLFNNLVTLPTPGGQGMPSLYFPPGSTPTVTILDGYMWFDGTALKMRVGGVTKTITMT